MEGALKGLKDAIAGNDVESIKSATELLMNASQTFAQKLYDQAAAEQSAAGGPSGDGASSAPNDDEVVDAEIVDEGTG